MSLWCWAVKMLMSAQMSHRRDRRMDRQMDRFSVYILHQNIFIATRRWQKSILSQIACPSI